MQNAWLKRALLCIFIERTVKQKEEWRNPRGPGEWSEAKRWNKTNITGGERSLAFYEFPSPLRLTVLHRCRSSFLPPSLAPSLWLICNHCWQQHHTFTNSSSLLSKCQTLMKLCQHPARSSKGTSTNGESWPRNTFCTARHGAALYTASPVIHLFWCWAASLSPSGCHILGLLAAGVHHLINQP